MPSVEEIRIAREGLERAMKLAQELPFERHLTGTRGEVLDCIEYAHARLVELHIERLTERD